MEEHALIRLRHVEHLAHLGRVEAFEIAQGHDEALRRGERVDGAPKRRALLEAREERLWGLCLPPEGDGWLRPSAARRPRGTARGRRRR